MSDTLKSFKYNDHEFKIGDKVFHNGKFWHIIQFFDRRNGDPYWLYVGLERDAMFFEDIEDEFDYDLTRCPIREVSLDMPNDMKNKEKFIKKCKGY